MIRRTFLAAGLLLSGVPGAGAADKAPAQITPAQITPAQITPAQITIDNFTFTPPQLTVPKGTRVTWTNHDDIPHTVMAADPARAIKSPVLDTDESFAFTFDKPGVYKYFCSLHPHMQGTVVVR